MFPRIASTQLRPGCLECRFYSVEAVRKVGWEGWGRGICRSTPLCFATTPLSLWLCLFTPHAIRAPTAMTPSPLAIPPARNVQVLLLASCYKALALRKLKLSSSPEQEALCKDWQEATHLPRTIPEMKTAIPSVGWDLPISLLYHSNCRSCLWRYTECLKSDPKDAVRITSIHRPFTLLWMFHPLRTSILTSAQEARIETNQMCWHLSFERLPVVTTRRSPLWACTPEQRQYHAQDQWLLLLSCLCDAALLKDAC